MEGEVLGKGFRSDDYTRFNAHLAQGQTPPLLSSRRAPIL